MKTNSLALLSSQWPSNIIIGWSQWRSLKSFSVWEIVFLSSAWRLPLLIRVQTMRTIGQNYCLFDTWTIKMEVLNVMQQNSLKLWKKSMLVKLLWSLLLFLKRLENRCLDSEFNLTQLVWDFLLNTVTLVTMSNLRHYATTKGIIALYSLWKMKWIIKLRQNN